MTSPTSPESPLKSAEWLLSHLADPLVRVLDCRYALNDPLVGRIAYLEGHVPGAIYADLETDLSGPVQPHGAGGRHPLPDPATLAAWLGSVGIGNDSVVVAYDDPSTGQGFYAARAWWLLRWLGHPRVYVLDGGWPAFLAAGGQPGTAEPDFAPTTFTPDVQPDMVATAEDVAGREAGTLLIDSRAPNRYRGEVEPLDRKAGHIPGAVNREWAGALDEGGHWRDAGAQAARLNAGDASTITYCGSGVSATPNLLARELAGVPLGPQNRLYAGSWSDWVSEGARPVATGEEAEARGPKP
ncbi:sulfurtransferase [Deinococcus metallilatus]|uniref:Sulfurtransferase n=1 Tax=Deinococcus metallilatus TaxID=1211322 RepID=A0AAJ5F1R2_9DEIO|nr:sulfurtransferase [Deinococcus metallilatus]MBB5297163.1 thiosulfate/3-mercaptopyruvate sulfurtransferase [Deinococcus metallilatus]QBY10052.1 sulfurtransferase [Deinococcus metallilatus]RXJ08307.1 sulfurtransferase [Deinococcus metallilatus]TLK21983.1 sulfurtransferase [Deinococcus metallilatus]GMA17272.1 thiosulfate sulfurtransferase [Deinococcus metallilatus]